ncbi:helix-turn-helix transcriptional regulator [Streptomyces sp. NPDC005374]|uniref:helix-turn-helix transcriptional regulator n=1 Tax=Streptomyces sp. NPDC005374 TaxID=3364713 RepID=UPI0036C8636E
MSSARHATTSLAERALPLPEVVRAWLDRAALVSIVGRLQGRPIVHFPDTATKLVVRVEENGRREAVVIGPRIHASYHTGEPLRSLVQLRLAPGTVRPLLGVPAVQLLGRITPLGELPSPAARRLAVELPRMDADHIMDHVADVLPSRLAETADTSHTELLRTGVDAMTIRPGRVPGQVREVARDLAISERHLRNLFTEGVGLSPKRYTRIDRVRAVLAAADYSWAELAALTGYYDQSHMTSDFRTLMGVPPHSYVTGHLPGAGPCQALTGL